MEAGVPREDPARGQKELGRVVAARCEPLLHTVEEGAPASPAGAVLRGGHAATLLEAHPGAAVSEVEEVDGYQLA